MPEIPREKPHRLPPEDYVGEVTVVITATVEGRKHLFVDEQVVERFLGMLSEECAKFEAVILVYCFMPDHLHVMLLGRSETAHPKVAFDRFKVRAGIWLRAHRRGFGMQANYHDHIVRSDEDWRNQARYIAANPVRAGLAKDPMSYPFTGAIGENRVDSIHDLFLH